MSASSKDLNGLGMCPETVFTSVAEGSMDDTALAEVMVISESISDISNSASSEAKTDNGPNLMSL